MAVRKATQAGVKPADLACDHGVSEGCARKRRHEAKALFDQFNFRSTGLKDLLRREGMTHLQGCNGVTEWRAPWVIIIQIARACVSIPRGERCRTQREAARADQPAASNQLASAPHSASPGGRDDQPQEDPTALLRKRTGGQALARQRACYRARSPGAGPGPADQAFEPGHWA